MSRGELFQLYPINPDGWVTGDAEYVPFPYDYPMDDEPYSLILTAYNEDERWPHTITARISVAKLEPGYKGFPTSEEIEKALIETLT